MREVLIGVVVKEWVATPNEKFDYSKHNKVVVEYRLSLCIMYWIKRF